MKVSGIKGFAIINGESFSGKSISIENGVVKVDGEVKATTGAEDSVRVEINGDCDRVELVAGTVWCRSAGSVSTASGDVTVNGDIKGNAITMSGDITARSVLGQANSMSGDIIMG